MTETTTDQTQAPEMTEEERAATFDHHVRHLRAMQAEIDNIASVAAEAIAKVRNRYDRTWEQYKPFLVDHAKRKIAEARRVTDDGEVKEDRHYKSIGAGGGVYFATKKGGVQITCATEDFYWFLLNQNIAPLGIRMVESYEVTDAQSLKLALLQAFERAYASGNDADKAQAALLLSHINETPDDPDGHVKVGTKGGWTANKSKQTLTRAIEGQLKLEDDDAE